jgi:hypothetical protein
MSGGGFGALVDADVIDDKPLWEDGIIDAALAAPGSADGEVQNDVLGCIEGPRIDACAVVGEGEIFSVVDEELEFFWGPFDGVDMEGGFSIRHFDLGTAAVAAGVIMAAGMDVGVDDSGVMADVFEDIDLAAGGPTDLADIGAEGPEGGPGAAAGGDFSSRLDAAVGPGDPIAGGEAGGGVVRELALLLPAAVGGIRLVARVWEFFAAGFDDEVTVLDPGILEAVGGVVLEFAIAHESFLVGPLGRIWEAVAVEVIGPDEFPLGGLGGGGEQGGGDEQGEGMHGSMAPVGVTSVKSSR